MVKTFPNFGKKKYCPPNDVTRILVVTDLQIILSLLGTRFIDPNPTSKSSEKIAEISKNLSKIGQNQSKNPKSAGVTLKILLMPKSMR